MERRRVVIESQDTAAAAALATALSRAGLEPLVCGGPDRSGGCPVLGGETCALIERADAVVFDLDLDRAQDRDVLRHLVTERQGLPIITERSTEEARRHREDLRTCTVVVPFSPEHTAEAVVSAIIGAQEVI